MRNRKNYRGTETTIRLLSNEPRYFVYNMIAELNPEGLETRSLKRQKKRKEKKEEAQGSFYIQRAFMHW